MEREQADDEDGREVRASMAAYYSCLRDNPHYRALWIADVIDNTGAWLNYVATLELMTSFSPSSLALSAVVLIRFIPSLLLSPLAGVLADSCNRVTVLVVAALVDALAVAALATVHQASQAPLLFALLAAQFAAIALQDPSRKAIVPALVPREQLHLAATLETFSWSLTGALGAGLGGLIASRLGNATCFLMDAATYLLAAWCLHKVPRELGDPGALERRAPRKRPPPGGSGVEMAAQPPGGAAPDVALDVEAAPLLAPAQPPAAAAAAAPAAAPAGGLAAAAAAACAEGVRSLREGWAYLLHRENRDVAALVLMKGCGSITWGAVDILNVKFSELPAMQVGDGATTLGLIFATVGAGCFLGPVAANALVRPRPGPLLWACAASFALLFLGSALMAAAGGLRLVLGATFVRAIGSATLWVYSTLLLQLRCPNAMLGRVSAAEMALYTVAEAASSVYGGAAFDLLHLSLRATVTTLACAAGGMAVGWAAFAHVATRGGGGGKAGRAWAPELVRL